MKHKIPSVIGAGVGATLFLAVALLPTLLYGGYAGLMLASGIFGGAVEPTFAVKALVVFGMALGVTAGASLFTVTGAVLGAGVSVILHAGQKKEVKGEAA